MVALSRVIYNPCNGLQTSQLGPLEQLFEQAKAPVWGKLGVPITHHAKHQSMQLFLFCSVHVGVQGHLLLAKTMVLKEVVQLADDCVG